MSLKTRLDGRSEDNSSIAIKDSDGHILATVKVTTGDSVTLEVDTYDSVYIEKKSGWRSRS